MRKKESNVEKKRDSEKELDSCAYLPAYLPAWLMYRVLFVCCVHCCIARFFRYRRLLFISTNVQLYWSAIYHPHPTPPLSVALDVPCPLLPFLRPVPAITLADEFFSIWKNVSGLAECPGIKVPCDRFCDNTQRWLIRRCACISAFSATTPNTITTIFIVPTVTPLFSIYKNQHVSYTTFFSPPFASFQISILSHLNTFSSTFSFSSFLSTYFNVFLSFPKLCGLTFVWSSFCTILFRFSVVYAPKQFLFC